MECSSAVVLSVLCFGFGEVLTGEIVLVILIMTKALCILGMPGGGWRIGESLVVEWGNSYSGSLKAGDAQRRCYCLTMKPFQRVKEGF